ncbi:hypothetical protein AWN61_10175 [Enterococcus faecium]|nr:hypothetical protein AWN61_10175 [Enterococcus faecium]
MFLDIIGITPCIRFHKSIIKEKTVDIIHKMDFVYSLKKQLEERILFFLLAVFFLFNISYVKLCLIWLFFW